MCYVIHFRKEGHAEDDDYKMSMQSYYTIAHSVNERVHEQPNMIQYGTLKPYQVRNCHLCKTPKYV